MTTVNPLPQVEHTASPHLSLSGTPLDPPAAIAHSLDSTLPPDSSQYSTSPFSQAPTAATHSQGNYSQIKLQRQLEYYFSRQNLVKDAFLVSQMDDDLYVPIAVIAKFKRVMEMTTSPQFLVDTLRQSSHVIVDPTGVKVKPNISMQRTTVILRDLPEATEQELTEFLQAIQAPPVQTMKQELGNMWYLTVATEDDALKMYSVVRGQSFKDHPVAARIKSESLVGDIQARKAVLRQQQQQQQQQHPFQQPFPQQQYHKPHHQQRQMYPPQRGNGNYMGYGRGQYHYQRQGQRNNYYTTNNYNQYVYHTQKQPAAFQRYRDPSLKQSQSNPTSRYYRRPNTLPGHLTSSSSPTTPTATSPHHAHASANTASPPHDSPAAPAENRASAPPKHHQPHDVSPNRQDGPSSTDGSPPSSSSKPQPPPHRDQDTRSADPPASPSWPTQKQKLEKPHHDQRRRAQPTSPDAKKPPAKASPSNSKWQQRPPQRKKKQTKSQDPVDLQSGTFFPPLPGGKTEPMTVSALLIERLSAADVVKKGQQAQPAVSSTSPAPASPPLSPPQEPAQDKAALNLTSPVVSTTAPTNPPTEIVQEDGFPVLGGAKDPSLVNGSQPPSFSYADMLKRD